MSTASHPVKRPDTMEAALRLMECSSMAHVLHSCSHYDMDRVAILSRGGWGLPTLSKPCLFSSHPSAGLPHMIWLKAWRVWDWYWGTYWYIFTMESKFINRLKLEDASSTHQQPKPITNGTWTCWHNHQGKTWPSKAVCSSLDHCSGIYWTYPHGS